MAYLVLPKDLYDSLVHIGMGKAAKDPYVPSIRRSCYDVIADVKDTVLKHYDEHNARTEFNAPQAINVFKVFKRAVDFVRRQEKTDLTRLYKETEERLMPSILAFDLSDSTKIYMLKECYNSSIPFSADIYTKMADVNVLKLSEPSKGYVRLILQQTLDSLEQYGLNYNLNLETFTQRMAVMETLAKRCDRQDKHLEEIFARTEFALRGTQYASKIKDAYFSSGNELQKTAKKYHFQKTWAGICAGADATGKNKPRKVDGIKPTSKPENKPNVVQGTFNFPDFEGGR